MQAVSAAPIQSLLQRKDREDSHSINKQGNATQSVFASYAFGPMDLNSTGDKNKTDPAGGAGIGKNPLSAHSMDWITQTQDMGADAGGMDMGTTGDNSKSGSGFGYAARSAGSMNWLMQAQEAGSGLSSGLGDAVRALI